MTFKAQQAQQRGDKAKMYRLAQFITSQAQLNLVLMAMPDPHNRGVFYELLKPCIKLFTPEYPDIVRLYSGGVAAGSIHQFSAGQIGESISVDIEIGPQLYRVN